MLLTNVNICATAFHWILSPEPQPAAPPIPLVNEVLAQCRQLQLTGDSRWQHARAALRVTDQQIAEVARATVGQSDNSLWASLRNGRLTASKFGKLLGAIQRGR